MLFSLRDWHIIEIEVIGPSQKDGRTFSVKTVRKNPADPGAGTFSLSALMKQPQNQV